MSDRVDARTVQAEGWNARVARSLSGLRSAWRGNRRHGVHAAYLAIALVIATPVVPVDAGRWSGPIRLPWYNQPGDPLGCPGAGPYKRWKRVIAVRPSDPRFKCGDRVELRYGKQTVIATVADSFSESAPGWVVFDAAARLNCDLLLPERRRSRMPMGYAKDCATLSNVFWRKVDG